MNILCPTCGKQEAIMHKTYGITACKECINKDYDISSKAIVDDGRKTDIQELLSARQNATASEKRRIDYQVSKIKNESSKVKSMRQELVRAMRSGNAENVREINEFVARRKDFQ